MRKLAFLLITALVLNLTAPAATVYAMPQETDSVEEAVVQDALQVNEDGEPTAVSENETSEQVVIKDAPPVNQATGENKSTYEAYVEQFNREYGGWHINPLYKDVIDATEWEVESDEIYSASVTGVESVTTREEAVNYIRQQMVARENSISFSMPFSLVTSQNIIYELITEAYSHSEDCSGQEGDALYGGFSGWEASLSSSASNLTITLSMQYHTTAEQEALLTEKVNQIMSELNFSNSTSEYDKVKAIHDYICDNVDYDYELEKYSAYEALYNGVAVCQGYAIAFYRLCKEAGLSVRMITGIGGSGRHAWNIVKIGDVYYNIDCTWDGQEVEDTYHDWFLLNEIDFVSHTRDAAYTTEEFYQTYPMAEYSYGKSTLNLLNEPNFAYSFKTLEETSVTSTANGKPKVLIFFGSNCGNSKFTIEDLVKCGLRGVDIYAIEGDMSAKEIVQEFKENHGDNSIIFSYATNYQNNNALWAYARAAGFGNSIQYPLICYIDSNNKLQYVTSGISNGAQISNYLKLTCGYVEQYEEYTITYHLDGGSNHTDNPATFDAKSDTITLKEANKTGYSFSGWYEDPEFVTKVTNIPKGTKKDITLYAKFVKELELTIPAKTTYIVGEKIDLTGGKVTHSKSGKSAELSSSMISNFDNTKEGVCAVTVTYQNCKTTFEVLVIKAPEVEAMYGQTLEMVSLPESQYGTFTWKEKSIALNQVGEYSCSVAFQPVNGFSTLDDMEVKVLVYRSLTDAGITYQVIKNVDFVYNGKAYKPTVMVYVDGEPLANEDYTVSYLENINAGLGIYIIEGKNFYTGNISGSFEILKADLVITAKDVFLEMGSKMPDVWEYEIKGLAKDDTLEEEPSFTVTAADTTKAGRYEIIPANAVVKSDNYNEEIIYVNGTLMIAEEKVGYSVSFDLQGHGAAIEEYFGIKAGDVIEEPKVPLAEGYQFGGWYKDANYKNVWNFATDTVQSDVVLYAKWIEVKNEFRINEIKDVVYNGKKLQPLVEVYDGEKLLKAKKDYKITYHNNTNVNSVSAGELLVDTLPYVTITGIGNYKETIQLNFNILPAVIGDGSQTPATGVVLNYTEQLAVDTKKVLNPFKSIKLGKTMKKGVDYTISLIADEAKNANGEPLTGEMKDGLIPIGSSGKFTLIINGIGNYTGNITKEIFVADKTKLLKNSKITLGKNLQKIDFEEYQNEWNSQLPAAYYDAKTKKYYAVENGSINEEKEVESKDVFVVKYGNTSLVYEKDFDVQYQNDTQAGKATLVIKGKGEYYGSKSITYILTGKTFSASKVMIEGLEPKTYTGKPIMQNGVKVRYKDGSPEGLLLEYGKHYTISYTKHINKGTATMTFTAKNDSGYSGSIKKTFKINAADINTVSQADMQDITLEYTKAGVKPVKEIRLVNEAGITLVNGKDYTLSYENNKIVADKFDEKAPTIVVKGKGNYSGKPIRIPFTIKKAVLNSQNFRIDVKELAYDVKKAADYEYKPVVKIYDGGKALSINKDYQIEYQNHTQEAYEAYYISKTSGEEQKPKVVITGVENSYYEVKDPIEVSLPIYQTKLTAKNIYVICENASYTGEQVTTEVAVYYTDDPDKMKEAKKLTNAEEILGLGLVELKKDIDYVVSFGSNLSAGKNKGSVTIKGKSPLYGGSVNVKFTINNKGLEW